jgi:hypothetical protein
MSRCLDELLAAGLVELTIHIDCRLEDPNTGKKASLKTFHIL